MERFQDLNERIAREQPNLLTFLSMKVWQEKNLENSIILELGLLNKDIPKKEWNYMLQEMESFLIITKEQNLMFHFLFDTSHTDTVPLYLTYELSKVLNEHRSILKRHLHSTIILTNSSLVKKLVETALTLYSPVRPINIMQTDVSEANWDSLIKNFKENMRSRRR